jgi:hypothetical protein
MEAGGALSLVRMLGLHRLIVWLDGRPETISDLNGLRNLL